MMDQEKPKTITQPWAQDAETVLQHFEVTRQEGLKERQVARQVKLYGLNQLRQAEKTDTLQILINQLKSLIVILLAAAAVLSFAFQEWLDGFAILGVIVINTAIGFFMELKAIRSMEALHQMERVTAKVRRNGRIREIPAVQLVPGDIVILEGGDIVSADMRLLVSGKLQADESVLTGESMPVSKQPDTLQATILLADRKNMLYKGTAITRGSGEAVVTATGMETELGHITDLVQKAEDEVTPLEKRLDMLGRNLLWVTLVLIAIIAVVGIWGGKKDVVIMIETAIALAVAAIPEGLPIVATLALARGMLRMARQNAIVNELAAVETLGSVSVICTDKTGTLTENKMTVTGLILSDQDVEITAFDAAGGAQFLVNGQPIDPLRHERVTRAMEIGVLCNNASLTEAQGESAGIGDPLEVALLIAARKASIDYDKLNKKFPEQREDAFDSDTKKMATFNQFGNRYWVAVKGAMEAVLADSAWVSTESGRQALDEQWKNYWQQRNTELAEKGLRVLALAIKEESSLEADPYEGLEFVGLVCMEDPAREDVRDAISACQHAGIQIVMVTGDHPKTAASIANSIGLTDRTDAVIAGQDIRPADTLSPDEKQQYRRTPVFARVSPKQKLDLIAIHQQAGSIVAMTGDGVNDAPALKKADIGIAMGLRGTQVAREAADMVLKDDAFSTIVVAVEQGRIIFENIRKFVVYLLSCNISEVMVVFAASLFTVDKPLPILPLQILFLNLVTDVFPALALGAGKGNPGIMDVKPRASDESILNRGGWLAIFGYGFLMTVSVLGAYGIGFALGKPDEWVVTVSFLTLAFSQLWHVFNMRSKQSGIRENEIVKNPYVWAALASCTVLLILAVYVTPAADILSLVRPGPKGWLLVAAASVLTCVVGQAVKIILRKPRPKL